MKRLLLICGLLWSAIASAQFVPGQLLTAAALNSAFANTAPAPGITCLGASSALNYTSNTFSCNAAINAVTLGGATFSAPGPIGSVSTSSGAFSSVSTPLATIGGGAINATTVGATSPSTGAFTTLSASSTVSGAGFTTLLGAYAPLAGATFTGQTSVGSIGGIQEFRVGLSTTFARLRERDTSDQFAITTNITNGTNTQDSASLPSWELSFGGPSDLLYVRRSPAGSGTLATLLNLSSAGNLTATGITNSPISGSTGSFTTLAASSTVSGTGFSNYLASPPAIGGTAAAAGSFTTLASTGNFTPSQTNGIVGTTTNNNANAGSVGEYVTATGTGVSLTTNTTANITSISLSAGDWDVTGNVEFAAAASTTSTIYQTSISTTSITIAATPQRAILFEAQTFTNAVISQIPPPTRLSLASTTTVYLTAQASFLVSTMTATGVISARRRR